MKNVVPMNHVALKDKLSAKLKEHYQNNLFRARLKSISKKNLAQKKILNFASNDYLGFANNPEIINKAQELMTTTGLGSTASNLITGYHTIHQDLEQEIASLLKCEQVILFPAGFMANLAIADTLLNIDNPHSIAIHDHNNHASILDGSRLAHCKIARYKHNSLDHLTLLLNKYQNYQHKFVFTESLFSMDGDFADLVNIEQILLHNTNPEHSCLIVDESHSFGLYNNGKGIAATTNTNFKNKIIMGTFGKALGTAGAFVAGPKIFIEALIQFARPYIYTTALSPIIAAATLYGLRINQLSSEFRDKLFTNIDYFCKQLNLIDFEPVNNQSPIQPIIIGSNQDCLKATAYLNKNNILLTAIRPPTVAPNKARLRITLSANHSQNDIDYLIKHLANLRNELKSNH
jgi:8-amino-7-oxononanoate synthase